MTIDVLADLLDAARSGPSNAVITRAAAPWAYRFRSVAGLGFHVVLQGSCLLRPGPNRPQEPPLALSTGDLVVLAAGQGHVLAGDPVTPPVDFEPVPQPGSSSTGRLGSGPGAETTLLCGAYLLHDHRRPGLLRQLPELVHLPAALDSHPSLRAAVTTLSAEIDAPRPGGDLLSRALVDSILVLALRAALDDSSLGLPERLLADAPILAAVQAMHADLGHPWTLGELAARAGLSRTSFVRRFGAAVGEPPMSHLTTMRMRLAAELLRTSDLTLARIAARVGYASEYALAKAFKRSHGVSPGRVRADK